MAKVKVKGKQLHCTHCGNETFFHERAELKVGMPWVFTFLRLTMANVYACERCGFAHWFFTAEDAGHETEEDGEPEVAGQEPVEPAEAIECLSCGRSIPAGADKCAACGWSWKASPETPPSRPP